MKSKTFKALISRLGLNFLDRGRIRFIDVGSIGGLPDPWALHSTQIKFLVNFEPHSKPIQGRAYKTCSDVLWDQDEVRSFYIYKGFRGTGSSLFKQNYKYVNQHWETLQKRGPGLLAETWHERSSLKETRKVQCTTLDGVLEREFPNTPFHFLKIDAQGAEYQILKGAHRLLSSSCIGLHLELFTIPLYDGIALFDEVSSFLASFGFELVKKFPCHGSFDSQNDCLFLNPRNDSEKLLDIIRKVYQLGKNA